MPVPGHPEHVGGQITDLVGERTLADPRTDQPAALDLVEQRGGLGLRIAEALDADGFRLTRGGHTDDASGLP